MAAVLLAFIAALRTLAVRGHQEILLGGMVDGQQVRDYDPDSCIRGVLWVAADRQAINDHIADFVRVSQMFLGVAITMVLLMGMVVLPFARDAAPQAIQGTIALDSITVEAAGVAISRSIEPFLQRFDEARERMESFPTAAAFDSLTDEVERLREEITNIGQPPHR